QQKHGSGRSWSKRSAMVYAPLLPRTPGAGFVIAAMPYKRQKIAIAGVIRGRERLSGTLNYSYRAAA
ncbi:MAG TPA: hypothetical protein VLJ11_07140, partial [Bryobacteraceae bacterium]|nr:hypothetical protein [Bryobacteraceae bacterium]